MNHLQPPLLSTDSSNSDDCMITLLPPIVILHEGYQKVQQHFFYTATSILPSHESLNSRIIVTEAPTWNEECHLHQMKHAQPHFYSGILQEVLEICTQLLCWVIDKREVAINTDLHHTVKLSLKCQKKCLKLLIGYMLLGISFSPVWSCLI